MGRTRPVREAKLKAQLEHVLLGAAGVATLTAVALGPLGPDGSWLVAALVAWALLCAAAIARSPRLGTLVTAVGAFGANTYLFLRKWGYTVGGDTLCRVGSAGDCDLVNSSTYSEVLGIPITLLGMGFYAGLAAASLSSPDRFPRFHQVNTLFAVLAVAYSAYLAMASFSLGAFCPFCVSIYGANLLLLWAGVRGLSATGGSPFADPDGLPRAPSMLTIVAGFLIVVVPGSLAWRAQHAELERPLAASELAGCFAETDGELVLHGQEPVLGDPEAPYLVVEFADYACPACAQVAEPLKALVEQNPDVQLRFKNFALSGACNPALQGQEGAERCLVASAAWCAGRQGQFWEMNHLVFRNQGFLFHRFDPGDLQVMARQLDLDLDRFGRCLEDPDTQRLLARDAQAGAAVGVHGTPSLYLKGLTGESFLRVRNPRCLNSVIAAHRSGELLPDPLPATAHLH